MKFVILALLVGMFIAFVVMVVKAAKEWRWYHITSAVITMILAILFILPTAGVLKSRQAWHKIKEKLELQLKQVEDEREELLNGDSTNAEASGGVRQVSLELANVGVEAGRRWRMLRMSGVDPNTKEVTLVQQAAPAVPGADPAAAGDADPLVPVGLVVYGFAEGKFPGIDTPTPVAYLGEFIVRRSVPTSATIAPTFPLEPSQTEAIASGRASSWSLYELLPLDGHEPFIAEGSKEDDDNILGRVDDALVKGILGKATPETVQNYLRDGKRGAPEDPASRWVKIKFEEKYSIEVDSPEQRGALEGGFFDINGRAVDSRLQGSDGGSVSFAVGETIVVKEEAAKELIDQEKVASLVDTYYLRPLNDYRYILGRIRLQVRELDIRIAEMEYEKQVLEAAVAATVSMLEKGQIEKLKLEQDLAQHQVETQVIRSYHNEIREELRQMNEDSSRLFRDNVQRATEMSSGIVETVLTDT